MTIREIHQCECKSCRSGGEQDKQLLHYQINLLISRMDEQQRRWYAALEAKRRGHGGMQLVSQITGLDVKTIRRGKKELDENLTERPLHRVRLPGGGRPTAEKN